MEKTTLVLKDPVVTVPIMSRVISASRLAPTLLKGKHKLNFTMNDFIYFYLIKYCSKKNVSYIAHAFINQAKLGKTHYCDILESPKKNRPKILWRGFD